MPQWAVLLLVFPLVCAAIGYVTNVVAVKMIFRPYRRVSLAGLSIQGVLPKHQAHFAAMLAGIIVREFVTTRELVHELHTPEGVAAVEAEATRLAKEVVNELRETLPVPRQAMLAPAMVDALVAQVSAALQAELPNIVEAVAAEADELVDLERLVTEKFIAIGPAGLEAVIYEVSRRELVFIELYGGVFGAALGLFQFGVLFLLGNIALPIVGGLVGTITNWLAIQMLFYPREPKTYLGLFRYQGMFPRRQTEIATSMGAIAARQFIVPTEIFGKILRHLLPDRLGATHVQRAEAWLRAHVPPLGQVLDGLLRPQERDDIQQHLITRYPELRARATHELLAAAAGAVKVDDLLAAKVGALEKSGFEQLLRGLFEREELYLIIYGGALGAIMGFVQLLVVHAAS